MTQNTVQSQSPRKPGFYSACFTGDQLVQYEELVALGDRGLDEEIAFLRLYIRTTFCNGGFTVKLLLQALRCLKELLSCNRRIFYKDDQNQVDYEASMARIFREVAEGGVPLEVQMLDPFKSADLKSAEGAA